MYIYRYVYIATYACMYVVMYSYVHYILQTVQGGKVSRDAVIGW